MNWGELQAAVPFRLNRDDLPAAFVLEMLYERIDFFGPQVLQPAEQLDYSIVLQPGQQQYTLPTGTQRVDNVRVLYNGIWIPVPFAERFADILASDPLQPPFTSLPVSMCRVVGNQIRVFPTPNQQYPLELYGLFTIAPPVDPGDSTNWWCTVGRVLLINATCAQICREYLDIAVPNSPRIATFDRNTADSLDKLVTQSHQMGGPWIARQWL